MSGRSRERTIYARAGTSGERIALGFAHPRVEREESALDFSARGVRIRRLSLMSDMRHRELIGSSQQMKALQHQIRRVAASDAKVLITGESGVGKELVAHALHDNGPRASQRFVPVNCAGLPETLLESELFGHVKGSFTGAFRDQAGKLEQAHLGTVFLDELGEMTARMQA